MATNQRIIKPLGLFTDDAKIKELLVNKVSKENFSLLGAPGSKLTKDGQFSAVITGFRPLSIIQDEDNKQLLNFGLVRIKMGKSVINDSFLCGDDAEHLPKIGSKCTVERRF